MCFAVLAPVQLAWGFLTCRRSSKRLLLFGVVLSIAVVIAWALSRTTGLPVGPQPWHAEEVGVIDSIATADELLLALVVSVYGLSPPRRPVGVALGRLALGCAVVLVTVSSLALLGAAHVS
jgi:hypothetical protein